MSSASQCVALLRRGCDLDGSVIVYCDNQNGDVRPAMFDLVRDLESCKMLSDSTGWYRPDDTPAVEGDRSSAKALGTKLLADRQSRLVVIGRTNAVVR